MICDALLHPLLDFKLVHLGSLKVKHNLFVSLRFCWVALPVVFGTLFCVLLCDIFDVRAALQKGDWVTGCEKVRDLTGR